MTAREGRDGSPRRAVVLFALLAGCQAPPARPAACNPDVPSVRRLIVARQVAADTAVYSVQHPLRSARIVATEPPTGLRDLTVGAARKCLAGRSGESLP